VNDPDLGLSAVPTGGIRLPMIISSDFGTPPFLGQLLEKKSA
jgi:hypothetical protein